MGDTTNAPTYEELHSEILDLEAQTWEALKKSGRAIKAYLADDCVMIFPGSSIFDANSRPSLSDILDRDDVKPWTKYEMDDVRVIGLGVKAAMICYRVDASRGDEAAYEALITSVWRRDEASGKWLMVLHQQTPLAIGR